MKREVPPGWGAGMVENGWWVDRSSNQKLFKQESKLYMWVGSGVDRFGLYKSLIFMSNWRRDRDSNPG